MKSMSSCISNSGSISRVRLAALTTCAIGAAMSFGAAPALAQEADNEADAAQSGGLNVIVVTARKNEESLQEVPVAVTAVGGAQIDAFELDKAQEIATRVPSLAVAVGGSGGGASISLRGIGSSSISAAFDSAVALNIDGVVTNSARLVQNSFMDLEQVEVLKGPQSLYFGKSASAGVLSFKSRDPGDTFEAALNASYEFEEDGYVVDGFLSGPLSEDVGARLAFRYNKANEVMINDFPGAANPDIGEESFDARFTLAFEPTSRFRANIKVAYSAYENDVSQLFFDMGCAVPGSPSPSLYSPLLPLLNPALAPLAINQQIYECGDRNQIYTHAEQSPIEAAQMPRNNGGVPYADVENVFGRLLLEWDVTDSLTISSVTGLVDLHSEEAAAYSRTTEGGGWGTPINDRESFSQELRLASDFDGPFNFQLGAFYEDRTIYFQTGQTAFGATLALATLFPLTGGAAGPFGAFGAGGADPATGNTYDWEYIQRTTSETLSAFVSADLELTPELTLSGGVRWTDERKRGQFTVPYTHGFLQAIGFTVPNGAQSPVLEFDDENYSPEVSLRYQINPDVNIYAAYKSGFKSGGIDNSALPTLSTFNAITACAPAFNPDTCEVIFDSETSKGFEAGLKSELFGRSLRLNVVAYRYKFNNLQNQQFIVTQTLFRTFNVGEITTQGIEADFLWKPLDAEDLTIYGAVGYLDSEFTEDFVNSSGVNLNGQRPASSPKWSGNVGADYFTLLGNSGLKLGLGANFSFTGSRFGNDAQAVRTLDDPYQSLDLRASLGAEDDRWSVSVIGSNVTDEIWNVTSGSRPFAAPGAPSDLSLRQNRGRQVFVKVGFRY